MRIALQRILESNATQYFIISLVVLDSILVGFISYKDFVYRDLFEFIDSVCLWIFIIEIMLKIFAFRKDFVKSKWNLFDLAVIILSILPILGNFVALRLVKSLRLVSAFPQLRLVIAVMLRTVPSVTSLAVILVIIFYVYAIFGVQVFAEISLDYFGNIGISFFSLFQIMTGDDWGNIARPILEIHPYSWTYFISFIFVASFIMLNMVVGIIVDSINEIKHQKD